MSDLETEILPDGSRATYRIMGLGLFAPKWRALVRVELPGTWEGLTPSEHGSSAIDTASPVDGSVGE